MVVLPCSLLWRHDEPRPPLSLFDSSSGREILVGQSFLPPNNNVVVAFPARLLAQLFSLGLHSDVRHAVNDSLLAGSIPATWTYRNCELRDALLFGCVVFFVIEFFVGMLSSEAHFLRNRSIVYLDVDFSLDIY